jgi:hypothetical protein
MRFAGKKRNEVSNPCLTAREAIVIADHIAHAAAVSAAENARLHAAIRHYEAALKEAWPEGAKGKSFEHWNSARIAIHGNQP